MDPGLQQLVTALQNAKSPNSAERLQASEFLVKAESAPGFVPAVFRVAAMMPDLPVPIRQMAAINCKNACLTRWTPAAAAIKELPEDEKAFIREHIIDALAHTPRDVRVQLELVMGATIVDFPDKFPNFGNKVMSFLTSNESNLILGGLLSMRQLCREIDQFGGTKRPLLFNIVAQVFPLLLNMFKYLQQFDTLEAYEMQLVVVKTLWSACQVQLPPHLADDAVHAAWMEILFHMLDRPEPAAIAHLAAEQRGKHPYWKIKKWIAIFFRRHLNRYSRVDQRDIKENSPNAVFAPLWMNKYSVPCLQALLRILDGKGRGAFVPDKIVSVIIDFLGVAIMPAITWQAMLPIIQDLFRHVLFPLVCFSDSDWHRFQDDAAEWIRLQYGDASDEELYGSQYVASFLVNLVRYRAKDFLMFLMNFMVNEVMQQYAAVAPEQRTHQMLSQKFGVMDLMAALATSIKRSRKLKPHLEEIMAIHILPELSSNVLFLRAKACQVFSLYYDIDYRTPQIFISGLEHVLSNVNHPDPCVKGMATIALHLLVQSDLSRDVVSHVLPNVIDVVFSLVDELDNEEVVKTLQTLILTFPEQILPRAVDAVRKLAEHWHRLVQQARADHNDDVSAVTAIQMGGAIASVCDALATAPQVFPHVEPFVIPICHTVLKEEMTEYLDEVIKILTYLTLHESPISDNVWSCWPMICQMLTSWASDYLPETLAIFDNFISRSTEKFLSSGALDMILSIYNGYMTDLKRSEYSSANAAQIMEVILVYCRGRVDHLVPHAIATALSRFTTSKKTALQVLCLEVVANAIIYSPNLALSYMEQKGYTTEFFQRFLDFIMPPPKPSKKKKGKMRSKMTEAAEPSPFTRLHDKQVCIMALSSVFHIPVTTLPQSIQQFLPRMIACILKLQDEFAVQKAMLEAEDDDDEGDAYDEHEDPDAEGPAHHEDLMQRRNVKFDFDAEPEDGGDDIEEDEEDFDGEDGEDGFFHVQADEEGNYEFADTADVEDETERAADALFERMAMMHEDEFEVDDDEEFSSQLDEVDPVIFFMESMLTFTQRDGAAAQQVINSLSVRQQKMLNELEADARKRKMEAANKANNTV